MREQKDRYEIFLKVCETGSFSKAAEALNYTHHTTEAARKWHA